MIVDILIAYFLIGIVLNLIFYNHQKRVVQIVVKYKFGRDEAGRSTFEIIQQEIGYVLFILGIINTLFFIHFRIFNIIIMKSLKYSDKEMEETSKGYEKHIKKNDD